MINYRRTVISDSRDGRPYRQLKKRMKYIIVTDGDTTEMNYFTGLFLSISQEIRPTYKILKGVKPDKFLEVCRNLRNKDVFSDYSVSNIWIVFDQDKVSNFDKIISDAEIGGYRVAWSNPCIEVWFWAYFQSLGSQTSSVEIIDQFKELFGNHTGKRYAKNLSEIYKLLCNSGSEKKAILHAEVQLQRFFSSGIEKYSEMQAATKVHCLVKELKYREIT